MTSNPLAYLPGLRKQIYSVFWAVGILIGAIQVGYASTDNGTPGFLKVALAVYAFLGGAVGYTASQNVDVVADEDFADEADLADGVEGADA
jgi:hypothetical protein